MNTRSWQFPFISMRITHLWLHGRHSFRYIFKRVLRRSLIRKDNVNLFAFWRHSISSFFISFQGISTTCPNFYSKKSSLRWTASLLSEFIDNFVSRGCLGNRKGWSACQGPVQRGRVVLHFNCPPVAQSPRMRSIAKRVLLLPRSVSRVHAACFNLSNKSTSFCQGHANTAYLNACLGDPNCTCTPHFSPIHWGSIQWGTCLTWRLRSNDIVSRVVRK